MDRDKHFVASPLRQLSIDSIDVENEEELAALMVQVLSAGNAIAEAERAEMIAKGIIDARGNLLKTELPEDMREDVDRDFGG
jgi:hypothetical protein